MRTIFDWTDATRKMVVGVREHELGIFAYGFMEGKIGGWLDAEECLLGSITSTPPDRRLLPPTVSHYRALITA